MKKKAFYCSYFSLWSFRVQLRFDGKSWLNFLGVCSAQTDTHSFAVARFFFTTHSHDRTLILGTLCVWQLGFARTRTVFLQNSTNALCSAYLALNAYLRTYCWFCCAPCWAGWCASIQDAFEHPKTRSGPPTQSLCWLERTKWIKAFLLVNCWWRLGTYCFDYEWEQTQKEPSTCAFLEKVSYFFKVLFELSILLRIEFDSVLSLIREQLKVQQ